ncbi:unnamed protein product [Brassica napus]|uniref:(rape) hypothetical protein n=1 Tax=Brassica napus TaxID=3708 RepID=A0A816SP28_BRANA|nr:unnamed protein product [Brassica napus]
MAIMGGEVRRVTSGGDTMEHSSWKEISPTQYKVIETVFMTAFGGVSGAVLGGIVGTVIMAPMARRYPQALAALRRTQYARAYALEGSAVFAAWFGIESIMRGIRGKDDLTSRMVSASGGGLAYSFAMKGLTGQPAHALFTSAYYAALSGTTATIKSRNAQDAFYIETKAMLSKLDLEEYEKNFKKGHLTDPTLPFLTDSVLQEVNIPPGPRLLILDHIQRFEYKLLYSYMDQIYEFESNHGMLF